MSERAFELQGHRGARGLFPENTIEGFRATAAVGVDSMELDIAVTADGVPIVSHDPTLDPELTRGPDGAWIERGDIAINDLTLAELRGYDVGRIRPGSKLAARFPLQHPVDGARLPTLAEVFAAVPHVLHVEIKTLPDRPHLTVSAEAMAAAVLAVAEAAGAMGRMVVRSFDWRGLAWLKRTRPALPLVWLTGPDTAREPGLWWEMPGFTGPVHEAVAHAAAGAAGWVPAWAPRHDTLDAEAIAAAHAAGLAVMPWTVDEPAHIARLIAWGVDGICTDRPDVARDVMRNAGLRPPPVWPAD